MISEKQEYLNLNQAAEYIGIGKSTAKRIWPGWKKFGVVPSRLNNMLRFKRSKLDAMMEKLQVQ